MMLPPIVGGRAYRRGMGTRTDKPDRRIGPVRLNLWVAWPSADDAALSSFGGARRRCAAATAACGPLDQHMTAAMENGRAARAVLSALYVGPDAPAERAARAPSAVIRTLLTELP